MLETPLANCAFVVLYYSVCYMYRITEYYKILYTVSGKKTVP